MCAKETERHPPITGTLCVVHADTEQIFYRFRKGDNTEEEAWAKAGGYKDTHFPSHAFVIQDLVLSKIAVGAKTGYYNKVLFVGADDPIVIKHKYKKEETAQEKGAKLYEDNPGVQSWETIAAANAIF